MSDGRRHHLHRGRSTVVPAVVAVVVAALLLGACEEVTGIRVNDRRAAASLGSLVVAADRARGGRARSRAMCTAGAATPSPDAVIAYRGSATTDVAELVGAAPMDPGTADPGKRNGDAGNLIWAQWQADPRLVDPQWES